MPTSTVVHKYTELCRQTLHSQIAKDAPGWSATMIRNGEEVFALADGWALAPWDSSLGQPILMTPDTRIHLASVSKFFTGCAVLAMIEDWNQVIAWAQARHGFLQAFYVNWSAGASTYNDIYTIPRREVIGGLSGASPPTDPSPTALAIAADAARECRVPLGLADRALRSGSAIGLDTYALDLMKPRLQGYIADLRARHPGAQWETLNYGADFGLITLKQIMQHRLGIDESTWPSNGLGLRDGNYVPLDPNTHEEIDNQDNWYWLLWLVKTSRLPQYRNTLPPNVYSNNGYALLRGVVEAVTGMRFTDWVEQRVFARAGDGINISPWNDDLPSVRARYYQGGVDYTDPHARAATRGRDMASYGNVCSAGGYYGSTRDVARVVHAFNAGKIVSSDMVFKAINGDGAGIDYVFPFDARDSDLGRIYLWKNGGTAPSGLPQGCHAIFYILRPDTTICVAINSPDSGPDYVMRPLVETGAPQISKAGPSTTLTHPMYQLTNPVGAGDLWYKLSDVAQATDAGPLPSDFGFQQYSAPFSAPSGTTYCHVGLWDGDRPILGPVSLPLP